MPDIRVLNELTIKKDGVSTTYKLGTVNGYYNPTDGKFYEEVTHVTEIEGAPNLVYADIAGNALYIYKTATSSFVKVSGEGGGSADNLKFGYLNDEDGKFYEDDQYQVEIPGNADYLFIGLDNNTIYRYDTSDTTFVAIGGGGSGTEYQAGTGIDITDGVISGNYKGGFNIKIDGDEISTKTFVGTLEEWNNLTSAQKAKFDTVSITDDETTPIATPGHEVLDSIDTPLPQRTNIQFEGAEATDDDINDITKITVTPYTAGDGIEINDHEVSVTEDRPATFVGTTQEWDALTAAEKAQYKIVNLTNDIVGGETVVVDTVESGNLNPVTSNAVYDAIGQGFILIEDGSYVYSVDATTGASKTFREFFNECNARFISKLQELDDGEYMELTSIQSSTAQKAINGINLIRRLYNNATTAVTFNTMGTIIDTTTPSLTSSQIRFHATTSRYYTITTTSSGSTLTVNDTALLGGETGLTFYYRKYRRIN